MTHTEIRPRERSARCARAGLVLAAAVGLLGLWACSEEDGGQAPPPQVDPYFPADYLGSYVEVRDCRNTLEHADNGAINVRVYASPTCAAQYQNGVYPLPEGAILVKPMWGNTGCTDLVGYVVMRKGPPGTAPTMGDWEWQEVSPDRRVLTTGVQTACLTCHADVDCIGRDFTCTDP
jgi:hypothetical protein